jgi:signal transduction histidine kinase
MDTPPSLLPLALWFAIVLLAGRFTIRPLARLASRAALQRDLVVAATEAERARVAADIHDDALQDLTILVHRLDSAGDTEGAEIARTVSDRLRAICGDLRLPILDDLGVGPALDWLVLRIERLAGGEVRLERSDGTRPPADVELAFFRVAQEALANAVKHGRPPITVRYSTTASGASLSIDDAGTGIEPDVVGAAEQPGHFGLLNMQQRAEAIGAILDVRRWPNGGTHVALEWRAT